MNARTASRLDLASTTLTTIRLLSDYDETHPLGVGGDREEIFRHSVIHTRGNPSERYHDLRSII